MCGAIAIRSVIHWNWAEPGDPNDLPIIEIASDRIVLKIGSESANDLAAKPGFGEGKTPIPTWQRWNDYGIGLLLKGKAELRQAAEAFQMVESLGRFDGPLNLARAQFAEGDLNGATESLARAASMDPPPPSWTHGWLSGVVNRQQGNLDEAVDSLRGVLSYQDSKSQVRFLTRLRGSQRIGADADRRCRALPR